MKTVYEKALSPGAGFDALRSKNVDLGISAILMTATRDREFDFSQPILEAGQQVMIRSGRDTVTESPCKICCDCCSRGQPWHGWASPC
jgi:polar amino acid transport system substrate-binding protein